MDDRQSLATELDALEGLLRRFNELRRRDDAARKRELVQARVQLSRTISAITATSRKLLESDRVGLQDFSRLHSTALSKIALHQAVWPAVNLDVSALEYRQSAQEVDDAITQLIAWLRERLPRGRDR